LVVTKRAVFQTIDEHAPPNDRRSARRAHRERFRAVTLSSPCDNSRRRAAFIQPDRGHGSALVSLEHFNDIAIDRNRGTVSVGAGNIALHFTRTDNDADVEMAMPIVEAALNRFHPRAHWREMYTLSAKQVTNGFERIGDFHELCRKHDPEGKFTNPYLAQNVFGA
jgi:hypothetical protein